MDQFGHGKYPVAVRVEHAGGQFGHLRGGMHVDKAAVEAKLHVSGQSCFRIGVRVHGAERIGTFQSHVFFQDEAVGEMQLLLLEMFVLAEFGDTDQVAAGFEQGFPEMRRRVYGLQFEGYRYAVHVVGGGGREYGRKQFLDDLAVAAEHFHIGDGGHQFGVRLEMIHHPAIKFFHAGVSFVNILLQRHHQGAEGELALETGIPAGWFNGFHVSGVLIGLPRRAAVIKGNK